MLKSPFRGDLLNGHVAIVTGGGTGIGRATALQLLLVGAKVAICGRRKDPLQETKAFFVKEHNIHPSRVHWGVCDIRSYDMVADFVKSTVDILGHVDILVNNAGGQFVCPAQFMSAKGFSAVVNNNLVGTWNMSHAVAVTSMIPQSKGVILSVTAQVRNGFPGMAHTGAARAGVANLMKTLAIEWAPYNIQCNAVAPGVIKSSGTERYPPELLKTAVEQTLLRRLGTVDEVASLLVYLACPAPLGGFVTGQTWYIDGGTSIYGSTYNPWEMAANARL